MSHSFMRNRKQKALALVCYRCGASKKKDKCKQYGNMVWCLKCKGEVEAMEVPKTRDGDIHRPFGFGSPKCRCPNGKRNRGCLLHKALYLAQENREKSEDAAKNKPDQGPYIFKGKLPPRKKKEVSNVHEQVNRSAG